MTNYVNAAFIQYKPVIADPMTNFEQVEKLLERIEQDTDLVVLPELAFTGYNFDTTESILPYSEHAKDSETTEFLTKQSQKHGIHIIAGFSELDVNDKTKIYNSSMLVGVDGLVGTYRKIHLFGNEKVVFQPGDEFKVFPLKLKKSGIETKLGILVCFDWIFAESWLSLFHKGAALIAHCTNLVLPGKAQKAVPVLSMMHRIPVVMANRYGTENSYPESKAAELLNFTGNSIITDARGEVLVSAPESDDFVGHARINIDDARNKQVTDQNNLISDRNGNVYEKNGVIQKS